MIREMRGDILNTDAQALVIPVNTEGVMGAGLAAQARAEYPQMFEDYARLCAAGAVQVGVVSFHPLDPGTPPHWAICLPTKVKWKEPSQLDWVTQGLMTLRQGLTTWGFRSVAVPRLGCGLGGLSWKDVYPLVIEHLWNLPAIDVQVYTQGPR